MIHEVGNRKNLVKRTLRGRVQPKNKKLTAKTLLGVRTTRFAQNHPSPIFAQAEVTRSAGHAKCLTPSPCPANQAHWLPCHVYRRQNGKNDPRPLICRHGVIGVIGCLPCSSMRGTSVAGGAHSAPRPSTTSMTALPAAKLPSCAYVAAGCQAEPPASFIKK